jgi:hypothetical protein
MDLQINPHELIMIGENSFVRLTTDNGQSASTKCSHWRVLWSPAGAGHALFVDSTLVGDVRISVGQPCIQSTSFTRRMLQQVHSHSHWRNSLGFISATAAMMGIVSRFALGLSLIGINWRRCKPHVAGCAAFLSFSHNAAPLSAVSGPPGQQSDL